MVVVRKGGEVRLSEALLRSYMAAISVWYVLCV